MKKFLSLFLVLGLFFIVGCESKKIDTKKIATVSNVELGKKQYIEQLVPVKINSTEDTITITSKVKWEVPEHKENETVSFAIAIPYTITIDGIEYKGIYELNDFSESRMDNNLKYDFEVTNLTSNGDIEILITEKVE